MKPAYVEYELDTGDYVAMTINFEALYRFRSVDKMSYKKVSKIISSGPDQEDAVEIAEFIYGAYKCANQDKETMSFTEFLEKMNKNITYNANKMRELMDPKQPADSEEPLETL